MIIKLPNICTKEPQDLFLFPFDKKHNFKALHHTTYTDTHTLK